MLSLLAFVLWFEGKEQESASVNTKGYSIFSNKLTDKP